MNILKPIRIIGRNTTRRNMVRRSTVKRGWNLETRPARLFRDSDRDGVADVFDCQPRNKRRQDGKIGNIQQPSSGGRIANMANPAAVYARNQGYGYNIITDSSGNQSGQVTLPGGQVVDEWSLFRQTHPTPSPQPGPPGPKPPLQQSQQQQFLPTKSPSDSSQPKQSVFRKIRMQGGYYQ